MRTKEEYHDRLEEQLKEWNYRIDLLKGEVLKRQGKAKSEFHLHMEELVQKKKALHREVDELKKSSGKAWVELKASVENAAREFKTSLERTTLKII
jgi:hypothetical protein